MVVILLGRDTKTQHHHIQECRLRQLDTTGAVVVARMKLNLVDTGPVLIALQQRRIDTTIAIGYRAGDQFQLRTFNAVQLDLDRAARATMCSVQNMCSQTSH